MIGHCLQAALSTADRNAAHWLTNSVGSRETKAGILVNDETALTLSGIFRAVDNIASHLAMLPLPVFKRLDGTDRERDPGHPLTALLNREPNPDMPAMAFRKAMQVQKLLRGRAFAEIVQDGSGQVRQLWPLHPGWVLPKRLEDDTLVYEVRNPRGGGAIILQQRQVLHLTNLTADGISGYDLVPQLARENIGQMVAIERYIQAFFGNGTAIGVILSAPGLSEEQQEKTKNQFIERHSGVDQAHKPLVLYGDWKVERSAMQNDHAQTLELLRFGINDVARWFNVPPHMLAEMTDATFSNIAQQDLGYHKWSLAPQQQDWTQELNRKLFLPAEKDTHFFDFINEAILRADPQARAEFYQKMWNLGAITINEIRARENLNSIGAAGEQHFVQLNMTTAERMLAAPTETQPTTTDDQPPSNRPQGDDQATRDRRIEALKRSYMRTVGDAAERMCRKESNALLRAHKRYNGNGELAEWAAKFYETHSDTMFDALYPHVRALAELTALEVAADIATIEDKLSRSLRAYCVKYVLGSRQAVRSERLPDLCTALDTSLAPGIALDLTEEAVDIVLTAGKVTCDI